MSIRRTSTKAPLSRASVSLSRVFCGVARCWGMRGFRWLGHGACLRGIIRESANYNNGISYTPGGLLRFVETVFDQGGDRFEGVRFVAAIDFQV